MLSDPTEVGNAATPCGEALFDPQAWAAAGALQTVQGGRGAAWFVGKPPHQWVLRHYLRGGAAARMSKDRYCWRGEARVRAFAEWRLLSKLHAAGLPVPRPVAARYQRRGATYCCDLITARIAGAQPVSALLQTADLSVDAWRAIGAAVGALHRAGVYHADLNAHNLLLDDAGRVSFVDFDRGRIHADASGLRNGWMAANLQRLRRSLEKICRSLPAQRFSAEQWNALLQGYGPGG